MPAKPTKFDSEAFSVMRPFLIRPVFERATIEERNQPCMIPRHQHLKYEVIFVDRGLYHCRHNENDITLGRNWLLIIKPGDWHMDIFDGAPLRYLALGFSLQMASGMPAPIFRAGAPLEKQRFPIARTDFLPLFEKIRQEIKIGDFVSEHLQDALVAEFLFRMIRAIPRDVISAQYLATSHEASFQTNLFAIINESLTRKANVGEMASALGISESSLAHKCRKILHCSPAHLFQRVKMDRAMQMLKSTDMQIKEVSDYLGFENPFHFSRAFKKTFGKAPLDMKADATPPAI